ncbi:MAG TPA: glycosyltransferase family 39 protein [Ardenticatenaceae bacterium]
MRHWRAVFLLSLVLYLIAALYQLELPGLNYDEALDAVPAMQFLSGQPLDTAASVHFAGREWPLMILPYMGTTSTYLYLPAFALSGVSVLTLRGVNVLLGFLTLLLVWGFLRKYLDERVAALTALLLAVNPTYVFWTRMGAYHSLPMLPLLVLTLWALYRWYRGGSAGALLLAAFCLGLGLSTKILFLWFWVALGLAWLLLSPWLQPWNGWRTWLWPLRRAPLRTWVAAGGMLALGLAMLLVYNVPQPRTVQMMAQNAVQTELYGVNNLDVLGNLRTVIFEDFRVLLEGSWFEEALGAAYYNPLAVGAFVLSTAAILWLSWRGRLRYSPRRVALLALLLVIIVVQSAFTITSLGAKHLMIVWPIPQTLVAVALLALADAARQTSLNQYRPVVLGIAVLALVTTEGWTTWQYHRLLTQGGGNLFFSDAIYELARDLEENGVSEPAALDWGFRRNLQLLTQGRVNPEDRFEYSQQPSTGFSDWARWRAQQEPTLYLFHAPERAAFQGHWQLWEEAAYAQRMRPVLWKEYTERDGEPIYRVYALEAEPRAFTPPEVGFPLQATFGDTIALLGFDLASLTAKRGESIQLTLYWQALAPPGRSYKVFAHLLDTSGNAVAQHDGIPHGWGYPTSEWQAGEIVHDRIRLLLPADTPPGHYRLFAGMYDEATGERLPLLHKGQRQEGDTLQLVEMVIE